MKKRILSPGIPTPDFAFTQQGSKEKTGRSNDETPDKTPPYPASPEAPSAPVAPTSGRDIRRIPVDLIDENPLAPREVYTPEMILARAEALRSQGQHDLIHVIPNPEKPGRFVIADGWTRTRAAREHKILGSLEAEVHHGMSIEEAAWFGYQQNEEREQHCDLDRGLFYAKMAKQHNLSQAEIARRVGEKARQVINSYMSYSKMPPELLDIVRTQPEKFSYNIASDLYRFFEKAGLDKAKALASKIAHGDYTRTWILEYIATILEPKSSTQNAGAASSKQIRYTSGYIKRDGEKFKMTVSVPADKQEIFAQKLEALLDEVAQQIPSDQADNSKAPQ